MEKSIYFFFQGIASKGLINSQIIIKTMVIFGKKKQQKRQQQLDQTMARRMSKEKRKEKDKKNETF